MLAKEIGDRPVKIQPVGADGKQVTFTQAAQIRDALKVAGVKRVAIALQED